MGSYSKLARCSAVVLDVFSTMMQKLLANKIGAADLYRLIHHTIDFKKILSGNEMITIQSLPTPDFSKLNFTLIYKLFKFFDLIQSPRHNWGVMPSENDIDIGDDVERMRFARQNVVSTACTIDCDIQNSEFETFFTDFEQLGRRIDIHLMNSEHSGFQRDIRYLKTIMIEDFHADEYIDALKDPEYVKGKISLTRTEECKYLSAFMNAWEISLPLAQIQQNRIKRHHQIHEIFLKKHEIITVGSKAEGLNVSSSDFDMISFANDSNVLNQITWEPIAEKEHPGYSKVLVTSKITRTWIHINNELMKYTHLEEGKVFIKNNLKELILHSGINDRCPNGLNVHGPAYNTVLWEPYDEALFRHGETKDNRLDVDFVLCIKINEWPTEAVEWTTRKRASNWPTNELLSNITKEGYFLAAVGSKESNENEIQWRVSFNKAEQLIIESFNETQMHCIYLLKLMKNSCLSRIAGKNITSYTMKTVIFWCLEEKTDYYWHPSNLLSCFCFCVSKLKLFVENNFLPNFFIRERNQFVKGEFTREIKNNTMHYLESFLEDPTAGIRWILPSYRENANTQICTLNAGCLRNFITRWLQNQISMAVEDPFKFRANLLMLYDEKPIKCIFERCEETLKKLKTVRYAQPLIKKLQNYMGVLQYILLMEEKKRGKDTVNSVTRHTYSKYMILSDKGDLTHNPLRIATCYLHDGVKEDCLSIIQGVTASNIHFYMKAFSDRLKQIIYYNTNEFRRREHDNYKMSVYNGIINNVDSKYHDPYKTFYKFDQLKERGCRLIGYTALRLAWKRCYFDVTFMRAELPVLPDPAAVELCIGKYQKSVSFHPFLYGLLLEFLWHEKYGSGHEDKESVLNKMKNCVLIIPNEHKSIGLNFMAYCYSLQNRNRAAFICRIQSLKFNPLKTNVAFRYMKYKLEKLRE